MFRRLLRAAGILISVAVLVACVADWGDGTLPPPCPSLPATFTKADLVGTWTASYSLHDTDTLLINADGTFKQTYIDPDANLRYESGWQQWWTETRKSGYTSLHLIGMHRAGETSSIFNRVGGGLDPTQSKGIDDCEGRVVEMPHEIVLVVTGTSKAAPRGLELRQLRLAGSTWAWSFTFSDK